MSSARAFETSVITSYSIHYTKLYEAGVVVTEHGAADLRGLPLRARAARMIAIAHPAFRESLEREAHAIGLSQG